MNETKNINDIGLAFFETKTEESFTRLYERITPGLFTYAMKVMKDHDLANHIVNKTMAMVHQKIDLYNPKYKMSTWIYRIAFTNACFELRAINKNKPFYISEFDEQENKHLQRMESSAAIKYAEETSSIDDYTAADEMADEVLQLEPASRQLIQDRFYEKMEFVDIAAKMNITVKEVKEKIRDIKRYLRTKIREKHAG